MNNHSNSNVRPKHFAAQELIEQLLTDLELLTQNIVSIIKQEQMPETSLLEERDRMIGILESLVDKNLATIPMDKLQHLIELNDNIVGLLSGKKIEAKDEISTTFKKKEKIKKYNLREVR